jgi:hypothetical protein
MALAVCLTTPRIWAVTRVRDKTIVLTFDDAVKSQITSFAPLLKQLGFSGDLFLFFISQCWMDDHDNFSSW